MVLSKLSGIALVASSLVLGLACGGGGGESNASAPNTTATINGVLDFDSGLSKSGMEKVSSGNVTLTNIDNPRLQTTVRFSGNATFSANVVPGNYEIQALRDDQKALRAYASASSQSSNDVTVDLDSSVTATYMDLFSTNDLTNLATVNKLVRDSRTILLSNSGYEDAERTGALLVESVKLQVRQETAAANILRNNYTQDGIKVQSSHVLINMVGGSNVITLASGNVISSEAQARGYAVTKITPPTLTSIAVKTLRERMIVSATDYTSFSLSSVDVAALGNVIKDAKTFSTSDIAVFGNGRHVYVMGRFFADFVDRFDVENLGISLYSAPYSTLSSTETSSLNPQSMIFQSPSRALITRLGTGVQWIVNPRASSKDDFFIQSVDLKHYADSDGNPEFSAGIFCEGKYFLVAQRLTKYLPSSNAYVAVLAANTSEINTGKAAMGSNLMGIELPARNPQSISYSSNTGLLYVTCVGQWGYFPSNREFTGGIVTINPKTYETKLLIDDDSSNQSTTTLTGGGLYGGLFSASAVVSETKGYLVVYSAWGSSSLRSFNPSTGVVGAVVSGFENVDAKQLVVDGQNRLWILVGNEIKILNTSTDAVESTVSGFTLPVTSLTRVQY